MRAILSPLLTTLAFALILCPARTSHAQAVTVNLSTLADGFLTPGTVIDALQGADIDFFGVLINTQAQDLSGANDLTMDSVGGNILGPGSNVTLDPTAFYNGFFTDPANPGLIRAQQTLPAGGTVQIFTVSVPLTASPGTYFGTFDLYDANANILGEAPFTLQVHAPATPEPTAGLALLCSVPPLFLIFQRKKRASRSI